MKRGRRSNSITIDICDYIDQIDDDDLLDEVHRRELHMDMVNDFDAVAEAYRELLAGRAGEALSILDRILKPKWSTKKHCMAQYQKGCPGTA